MRSPQAPEPVERPSAADRRRASARAVVELLLPAADARARASAESLVGLVQDLAAPPARPSPACWGPRAPRAPAAPARPASADAAECAAAIARLESERTAAALATLLEAQLAELFADGSFQTCAVSDPGAPGAQLTDAWRVLSEADPAMGPRAGEALHDTARRLLDSASAAALGPQLAGLWRARLAWAEHGPAAGERAHRALLAAHGPRADSGLRCSAARGVAESLLDRGQVRSARVFLDQELDLCSLDPELARLLGWCELLLGDERAARELLLAQPAPAAGLPLPMAELRRVRPEWGELLAGPGRPSRSPRPSSACDSRMPLSRQDLGAAVLAVFAWDGQLDGRTVRLECAPGLRDRVADWARARIAAAADAGEAEQLLVQGGREVIWHALGDGAPLRRSGEPELRGALSPHTRSLMLVPLGGQVGGWRGFVRAECEHHLLPSTARLEAYGLRVLAGERAVGSEVLPEPDPTPERPRVSGRPARAPWRSSDAVVEARDPLGSAIEEFVGGLGLRLDSRRWWGYQVSPQGELEPCASAGGALDDWRARRGGGLAVRRALAARAAVLEPQARPTDCVHAASASVLALPLLWEGRAVGALALESTRRNSFSARDLARWQGAAARAACGFFLASFRRWVWLERREELFLSAAGDRERAIWLERLSAAGDPEPLLIAGPLGSGKTVLARFLHFAGAAPARPGPFVSIRRESGEPTVWAQRPPGRALQDGAAGRGLPTGEARGGTLVAEEIDRWPAADQRSLAAWLDGEDGRASRLICTLTCATERRASSATELRARLDRDLARRVGTRIVTTDPLGERRGEIPGLAQTFARRFARVHVNRQQPVDSASASSVRWDDTALAFLWRQDWPGGVRELRGFVARVLTLRAERAARGRVDADELAAVCAADGANVRARFDSRRADRALLEQALESTRKQCGSWNKTRAALYLGWDPDTLSARLAQHALEPPAESGSRAAGTRQRRPCGPPSQRQPGRWPGSTEDDPA